MAASVATTDGRVPGRRGRATRQRLLEATTDLLATTPWRSVRVIDIARRAGTSPATFYQYFENVESAIGVLAEELVEDAAGLAELAEADWSAPASWRSAVCFCEGFFAYWEANRALFWVLDLAADSDTPLRGVRVRALNAVTMALARVVAARAPDERADGPVAGPGRRSVATAVSLIAMLASVARQRPALEDRGVAFADLVASEADLLHWAVTGRPGPP
ncbi:MAG TPA: TetR family transcriptional regulator [Acidimicrobiales bacterium]|nr:TetR family transcriptional regulator [Acidimicrobiales bacterium]